MNTQADLEFQAHDQAQLETIRHLEAELAEARALIKRHEEEIEQLKIYIAIIGEPVPDVKTSSSTTYPVDVCSLDQQVASLENEIEKFGKGLQPR